MNVKDKIRIIFFLLTFVVGISILVIGFFAPPTGVIHPSVLKAAGIVLAISALCRVDLLGKDLNFIFGKGEISVTDYKKKRKE